MVFDQTQQVFILEHYFRMESYARLQEVFQERFPNVDPPTKSVISGLVAKCRLTGSCADRSRALSSTVVTVDNIERVKQSVAENPRLSTRKRAAALNISRTSSQRILRTLQLKPIKTAGLAAPIKFLSVVTKLFSEQYCCLQSNVLHRRGMVPPGGSINAQNYRIWSSEKPQEFWETGLHPKKLGVWCAVSRRRIVGTIFLERTVTAKVYRGIVMHFISLLGPDECNCIFQQDGATAHTAQETIVFLKDFFGDRLHPAVRI